MKRRTLALGGIGIVGLIALVALLLSGGEGDRGGRSESPVVAPTAQKSAVSSVSGRVVDHLGRGIAGATVVAGEAGAETDDAGDFRVTGLEPGTLVITARAEGFIDAGPLAPHVEAQLRRGESIEGIELILRKPGIVAGRVTAGDEPVPARLSALYAGDEFAIDGIGNSAADGGFVLEGVPPGRLRILVETDQFALTESREIDLGDGERVDGVEIDLAVGGSIAGKVLDTDGNPVIAADVHAIGETSPRARLVQTTSTGGFRVDNFPAGAARLRVVAEGFSEEVIEGVEVAAGEVAVVEVVLERPSGVFGVVRDADGPVGGAFVVGAESVVRTDERGRFQLEDAEREERAGSPRSEEREERAGSPRSKDTKSVVAVSPRHAPSESVTPQPGRPVELTLGPGGTIRGRVVTSDGAPVSDFEIGIETFEVEGPAPYDAREIGVEQFVSSDGSFELRPLRPGRYWLRAAAPGRAPGSGGPVVVESGRTSRELVITLAVGGTVSGVVTDEAGAPVERAVVRLFDPMSPFRTQSTRTAADGRYTLRGVPSGRRSLRVGKRGFLSSVASGIDVPTGGEVTRNVTLGAKKPGEKFQFHGIGAVLRREGEAIEILDTMDDKPAQLFGLQKGDRIVAVDGESTKDLNLGNVVELIRGEEGAPVVLEVDREGEGRFKVEVERGRVVVK